MKTQLPRVAATKVLTGIRGFDEITGGGLPRGRTTLLMGGPGCGKTVFALQSLMNHGHHAPEAGIFVAFEESSSQIVANASSFNWNLRALLKKKLFFMDARVAPEVVKSGGFDLVGMLNVLRARAEAKKVKRVVFDGIDVLLSLLDDPVAERREAYRIRDWLEATGLTGIITQKIGTVETDKRNGFMQFMADCVIVLKQRVVDGSAFRTLRVMKYRGSGFAADEFPITLAREGMQLSTRGPAELKHVGTDERLSTGVARLDHMLRGGYARGSSVLISGSPGTAKTTLSGLFALAACQRGERTLFVSFDESAPQIVRNLRSVGIHLGPHVKTGLLQMYSTRTRGPNIEEQFGALRERVRTHQPRCLIIDPLSALSTKITHRASADAAQQFADHLKAQGITVVNTSLMDGTNIDEATATRVSIIADTWIHVANVLQDGERNRTLTVVMSRGSDHSNQVRELKLSKDGVTLTDVFVAQGKVLMGVARWESEQEDRSARLSDRVATDLKRVQLQLAQTEAAARLDHVRSEMTARGAEMAALDLAVVEDFNQHARERAVLRKMRQGDKKITVPAARGHARTTPRGTP